MNRQSVAKWFSDFKPGRVGKEVAERQQQTSPTAKHVLKQPSWITEE